MQPYFSSNFRLFLILILGTNWIRLLLCVLFSLVAWQINIVKIRTLKQGWKMNDALAWLSNLNLVNSIKWLNFLQNFTTLALTLHNPQGSGPTSKINYIRFVVSSKCKPENLAISGINSVTKNYQDGSSLK